MIDYNYNSISEKTKGWFSCHFRQEREEGIVVQSNQWSYIIEGTSVR